jgi:hypothetical protein
MLCLTATLCSPPFVHAEPVEQSLTRAVTIPLEDYLAGLRTVQVTAGGETLPYIFDTGGGVTLVTPEIAHAMGCEPVGNITGYRMEGERVDLGVCPETPLDIAGFRAEHDELAVFDIMGLLPDGWPTLGGLVSLRSFERHPVTLDLANNRLVVHPEGTHEQVAEGMVELEARIATGPSGDEIVPYVAVETSEGKLWMMLDSGNVGGVMLDPHAARMLGAEPLSTASDIPMHVVGLGVVTVDAFITPLIHDGAFSAQFMEGYRFLFDLERGRVWAAPAEVER